MYQYVVLHNSDTYYSIYPFHRSANTQPVSQVLSSQVTNTSATSPDIAVQLTFNYSVDVSLFVPVVTCLVNCV